MKPLLLMSLLFIPEICVAQDWKSAQDENGTKKISIEAEMTSPKGTSKAFVSLVCYPANDVGLYFEVEALNADGLKGIDLNDFEGPDAPYGEKELAHVSLTGKDGTVETDSAGAGWYSQSNQFIWSIAIDYLSPAVRKDIHEALKKDLNQLSILFHGEKNPSSTLQTVVSIPKNSVPLVSSVVALCEKSFTGKRKR